MTGAKGQILILTRHYPPIVSGGARRPFLLAQGLRERGWRVTVATPVEPADAGEWIETPHPAGLRGTLAQAAGAGGNEAGAERLKTALRRLVYWPDGDMRWALEAARRVRVAAIAPDWIVSTSPPESAHLAGRLVQKATGARWLAEMRDSWIDDPLREELRQSPLRRRLERMIARRLLSKATRIVAVSEAIALEAARYQPAAAPAPAMIGHFARRSEGAFSFEGPGPHLLHAGRFSLSHPERRIEIALREFERSLLTRPSARLHLVGQLTSDEIEAARACPAAANVVCHGEVSHEKALAMQGAADALVLFQPETAALPGKLSEYLLADAPILTVGAGAWIDRMRDVPHFPLAELDLALRSGRRASKDTYSAAIDAYEAIFAAG